MIPFPNLKVAGAVAAAQTVWDPANSPNATISNSNRTAAISASDSFARGVTQRLSSENSAYEVNIDSLTQFIGIGIVRPDADTGGGFNANGRAVFLPNGGSRIDATSGAGFSYAAGDKLIIRFAGSSLYGYKNGVLQTTLTLPAAYTQAWPIVVANSFGGSAGQITLSTIFTPPDAAKSWG